MTQSILIHLANGFEEVEAITIIDVLRRANLNVRTVSVTGDLKVTGAHQVQVMADILFEEADYPNAGMLILPGGMPGSTNLQNHNGLAAQLKIFNEKKKPIGAICAAPMVLGSLGILNGKKAVCYPGFEGKLAGATIVAAPFVVDGNIITGKGVGAALDFSLGIVKMLKGDQLAEDLRNALVMY